MYIYIAYNRKHL